MLCTTSTTRPKDKDKELGTVRHNIDQILNGELTGKQEQKKKSQEQEI